MNEDIAKPRRSTNSFINRGAAAAAIGIIIGWVVLTLLHTKRPDGLLVLWGNLMNNLAYWIFIDFPFIAIAIVMTGAGIGWLMSRLNERRGLTKPQGLAVGTILGAVLSVIVAIVVARVFDYLTLQDFQLILYGYYFVKCAAVIGATAGAIAGAYTGISVAKA